MLNYLLNNILACKFEFKKGNTIAALVEALAANFDSFFVGCTKKPQYQVHTMLQPPVGGTTDVMQTGCFSAPSDIYIKMLKVFTGKLMPFLKQYYFGGNHKEGRMSGGGYNLNKKVVVVTFLTRMRLFDEQLFANFAAHLGQILA